MAEATLTINGQSITITLTPEQIAALTPATTHPILWQPSLTEEFYYTRLDGTVCYSTKDKHDKTPLFDVFKTEKQAEAFAEYCKAIYTYKLAIIKFNNGWEPDWNNPQEDKWYMIYDHAVKQFNACTIDTASRMPDSFYFKSPDFYQIFKLSTDLKRAFLTIINYKG